MSYQPLSRGNRISGLINELFEAIRDEDSSVSLWRIECDLRAARGEANYRRVMIELKTREIEKARNQRRPRTARQPKRRWLT